MQHARSCVATIILLTIIVSLRQTRNAFSDDAPVGGASNETKKLQDDAKVLAEAPHKGDVETILKMTHPRVIENFGGTSACRDLFRQVSDKLQLQQMKLISVTFPIAPTFVGGQNHEFALIPHCSSTWVGDVQADAGVFLLGIKDHGQDEWKYTGIDDESRALIAKLFPDFPSESLPLGRPDSWPIDKNLESKLGGDVEVPGIKGLRIRPPSGYEQAPINPEVNASADGATWTSPVRQDGSKTSLMFARSRLSPQEAALPLEKFGELYCRNGEASLGSMTIGPVVFGSINGMRFARLRWASVQPETNVKFWGFLYVAVVDQVCVRITAYDCEPHAVTSLPLAGAAAVSFKFDGASQ